MSVTVKIIIIWDVMLHNLVEVYRCFSRNCCLQLQVEARSSESELRSFTLMMEVTGSSERLVDIYQTT
jgi:hypothetical protein